MTTNNTHLPEVENLESSQNQNLNNNESVSINIPENLKSQVRILLEELEEFRHEIKEKQDSITQRTKQIREKFESLKNTPFINPQVDVPSIFEKTTKDYEILVSYAIQEIDALIQEYSEFLKDFKVKNIAQEYTEALVISYVDSKIKKLKSFLKNRKKDFAVFFSRYDHGFNMHMMHLNNIASKLEKMPKK